MLDRLLMKAAHSISNQQLSSSKQGGILMEIQPLHDRLVVKRIEGEEIVKGGIVIPDTAREKPQSGVVMAIGKGKILENGTRIEMTVKEGDHILFAKYSGTEIKLDGEEYLILREDEVLAVTEGMAAKKSASR
jgi:chaperonin GroES